MKYTIEELEKIRRKSQLREIIDEIQSKGIDINFSNWPKNLKLSDLRGIIINYQDIPIYSENDKAIINIFIELFGRDPSKAELATYNDCLNQGMSVPNVKSVLKNIKKRNKHVDL